MPTEIQHLKFLNEQMGISYRILSKYCQCHASSLGKYVSGSAVPTEKALRCIQVGLQLYCKDFIKGMGL